MSRLVICFIPLCAIFFEFPITYNVRILKVFDGDTLLVKFGPFREKLRLSMIDAPELDQSDKVGVFSKKCLKEIAAKRKFHVMKIQKRDMYGRLLGELEGVGEEFIRRGCGGLYPYAEFSSKGEKMKYLRLLFEAKEKRKGLWATKGYINPSLWRRKKGLRFR